ncbi:MAG: choline dehydrogenase-like flavoprotein [Planctomycetota bacterium]|jgi:choline dehydrogenase-like flavoprotein
MNQAEKKDVLMVAAGATSNIYAALLTLAGKSVIVLEKSPVRKMKDLYSSKLCARRL